MVNQNKFKAKGKSNIHKVISITQRIIAVFLASGLSVIGAGTILGLDILKSVTLAGTLGAVTVIEQLARSFLDDGKLSTSEINQAFTGVDEKTASRRVNNA